MQDVVMTSSRSDAEADATGVPLVRLVGIDAAWGALLGEWLREAGYRVEGPEEIGAGPMCPGPCALVLLGLAFPRRDGPRQVQRVRQCWPHAPLVLASPTFHQGVDAHGPLARELGVAAILALPVLRTALLAVVSSTLVPPP
jgi:DNA-binding response OmpR family regulator